MINSYFILLLLCIIAVIVAQQDENAPDVEIVSLDEPSIPTPEIIDNVIDNTPSTTHALKFTTVGFTSSLAQSVLNSILDNPTDVDSQSKLVRHNQGTLLVVSDSSESSEVPSDVAFVYLNKYTLANEDVAVDLVSKAMSSLSITSSYSSTPKKALVLVIASKMKSKQLDGKLNSLLYSSWMMATKQQNVSQELPSSQLTMPIEIQVVSIMPDATVVADNFSKILKGIVSRLSITARPLESFTSVTLAQNITSMLHSTISVDGVGILGSQILSAIILARNAIEDSEPKLQLLESAAQFAIFVQNLDNMCLKKLREDATFIGITNPTIIKSAEMQVSGYIFDSLRPQFNRQVHILSSQAVKTFNDLCSEVKPSPRMIHDLRKYRDTSLNVFKKGIKLLIPQNAPLHWNCEYDKYVIQKLLDDFIGQKEDEGKMIGYLSRGRKPIELAFHTFFSHPLGRDYRQDVISGTGRADKPYFDPELVKVKDTLVKPYIARAILNEKLSNGKSYGKFKKSDSEFAREMLMFPLSIKNPSVALISGKSRRKSGSPKKDLKREEIGPERFIRWDMKPLDEVRRNLDIIQSEHAKNQPIPIIDQFLNLLPGIGNLYYESPPLRYGVKYAPSKSS